MNAFRKAQFGRNPKVATPAQLNYVRILSRRLGVEAPRVVWANDATKAIRRLEQNRDSQSQLSLLGNERP